MAGTGAWSVLYDTGEDFASEVVLVHGEPPAQQSARCHGRHAPRQARIAVATGIGALGTLLLIASWYGTRGHWTPSPVLGVKVAKTGLTVQMMASSAAQENFTALRGMTDTTGHATEANSTALRSMTDSTAVLTYNAVEWQVVCNEAATVRKERNFDAETVATKSQGLVLAGRPVADGQWLALMNEPGFVAIIDRLGQPILQQRSVFYSLIQSWSCTDINMFPIKDRSICQSAGFTLGYYDSTIRFYEGEDPRPEGCYEFEGQLWVAGNEDNRGHGSMESRRQICSSSFYPTTTTSTTTRTSTTTTETSTATTTTSTTWGHPSFFCMEVTRTTGYEFPLVKAQLAARASIFTCDEFCVFSDGGTTQTIGIGPNGEEVKTIVLPRIKRKKEALNLNAGVTTDSWQNTETFLQAWDLAFKKDGRLLDHDWVIKVDPDAVFFPDRLRAKLRPYTFPGAKMFVMNCDRYNPVALYGSLEIFSHEAIKTYLERQGNCRRDLNWHGWGEDFYMSHCMDHLGVDRLYEFSLIGDKRCHYAACSDTTKVVYHDYKGTSSWFNCWNTSRRAAER